MVFLCETSMIYVRAYSHTWTIQLFFASVIRGRARMQKLGVCSTLLMENFVTNSKKCFIELLFIKDVYHSNISFQLGCVNDLLIFLFIAIVLTTRM